MNYDELKFHTLRAINTLTPPKVMECSTREVASLLAEDGITCELRSLASHIGQYRADGMLIARTYLNRRLWRLTAQGRRWIADYDRDRRNNKAAHTKSR